MMVTGYTGSAGTGQLQTLTPVVCHSQCSRYLKQVRSCNDHNRGRWLPALLDRCSGEQLTWQARWLLTFGVNTAQHKAVTQGHGDSLLPVAFNELQAGRQADLRVASAGRSSKHQPTLWQGVSASLMWGAAVQAHSSQGSGSSRRPGNIAAAVCSACEASHCCTAGEPASTLSTVLVE